MHEDYYEDLLRKEEYTFAEYLFDKGFLDTIEAPLEIYRVMWCTYGKSYIQFCKKNNFYYEKIYY